MKSKLLHLLFLGLAVSGKASGQSAEFYTNFVRQVQYPSKVVWDVSVAPTSPTDGQLSELPIDPGGARFELWTVKNDPMTVYLLDTKYVGTVPIADVLIRTGDPNTYTGIPRTRADQPFVVDVTISELLSGDEFPEASKKVKLLRHVQSYGADGTDVGIDRDQAILLSQVYLVDNAVHRLSYTVTSVPGADRSKVRGEERFSVFSLEDLEAEAPESQLASMYVQIWPVADGNISGIAQDQLIRFEMPTITVTTNDLYPDSYTYVQVYKGDPALGTVGTTISHKKFYEGVPQDYVFPPIEDWDAAITEDGRWTMELLTVTPFGTDRLGYVSFNVDRTIEMNGTFTTIE